MKKFIYPILFLGLFLSSCSQNIKETEKKDSYNFWHITDTHYLSPSLNINSPDFTTMMLNADGKISQYSHDMVLAFKEEALKKTPDVILVSGDLTFNGEKESHIDFANILKEIQDNGTKVLVFPGNHDIDYPYAYSYIDNKADITDNVSQNEFEDIYGDFGYNTAVNKDDHSLSYIYKFADDIYFALIDTSTSGNGIILSKTLSWLDTALADIPKDATIISSTHQSLYTHNEGFTYGFVIDKNIELIEILNKYNVELNLSGHMHIQSILTNENLTDIATGAYSLYNTRYAIINYSNSSLEYTAQTIDVNAYAKENNIENEDLLNFSEYALDFYKLSSYQKALDFASTNGFSSEESEDIANFFANMNTHYFAGTLKDNIETLKEDNGYKLLVNSNISAGLNQYIETVMNTQPNNDLYWTNNK